MSSLFLHYSLEVSVKNKIVIQAKVNFIIYFHTYWKSSLAHSKAKSTVELHATFSKAWEAFTTVIYRYRHTFLCFNERYNWE